MPLKSACSALARPSMYHLAHGCTATRHSATVHWQQHSIPIAHKHVLLPPSSSVVALKEPFRIRSAPPPPPVYSRPARPGMAVPVSARRRLHLPGAVTHAPRGKRLSSANPIDAIRCQRVARVTGPEGRRPDRLPTPPFGTPQQRRSQPCSHQLVVVVQRDEKSFAGRLAQLTSVQPTSVQTNSIWPISVQPTIARVL